MNRYLLAAALMLAFSAPASAWPHKSHRKSKQAQVGVASENQWKSDETRRKVERREAEEENNDPYWDPCDYTTNWGPHACGGGP